MEPVPATTEALGAGARLERARTRLGWSRVQAGERLRLEPRTIEALECEQFDRLGASVYVRGHLRRYAELLGEDPLALERLYAGRLGTATAPDLTRVIGSVPTPPPRRLRTWPAAVIAVLLVLLAFVWWAMRASPPESGSAPAVAAAPAVSAAATAPVSAAPVAEPLRVQLRVSEDSWIELYDAANERQFFDLAVAGRVLDLRVRAPLRLLIGNAGGVQLAINGERRALPLTGSGQSLFLGIDAAGQITRLRGTGGST